MAYLDSWIWIEYVLGGEAEADAETVLNDAHDHGGTTSAITLTEVDYIIRREIDRETADFVTSSIEDSDSLRLVSVSDDIALRASSIRTKYYQRRERELSYADSIHIATAVLTDCDVIHTGDSDFESLDEIESIVHC